MRLLASALLLSARVALAQDVLDPGVESELLLTPRVSGLLDVVGMEFLPDGRLVTIEKVGRIRIWDGTDLTDAGMIVREGGGERGLLGFAIDPDFERTRRLYFYYSLDGAQQIGWAELKGDQVATSSITVIATGLARNRGHNGGGLRFGPDGHLYASIGNSGCGCTGPCPPGSSFANYFSTCLTNPHGKLLRIDREGGIPDDNPLVDTATVTACTAMDDDSCEDANDYPRTSGTPRHEIWAWGFRNPWRFSFDEQTGFIWVGDVGAKTFEEISVVRGPLEHHGWPFREGAEGQDPSICRTVVPISSGPCVDPVFAYAHAELPGAEAGSVTGGVFSNHCSWPEPWRGRYWFGDYVKTRIWTLTPNAARDGIEEDSRVVVASGVAGLSHFTRGPDGSIWYASLNDGEIWSIAPRTPADCTPPDAGQVAKDADPIDAITETDAATMDAEPRDAARLDEEERIEEPSDCACTHVTGETNDWGLFLLLALLLRRREHDRRPLFFHRKAVRREVSDQQTFPPSRLPVNLSCVLESDRRQ